MVTERGFSLMRKQPQLEFCASGLQAQATLGPDSNGQGKPLFCSGPAWEGHGLPGWSKETKPAIFAFRFGRDQECEIL